MESIAVETDLSVESIAEGCLSRFAESCGNFESSVDVKRMIVKMCDCPRL